MNKQKLIIGRKDVADFEPLQLYGVEVKIDTGAYTSSFHCHKIVRYDKNGENWVSCNFLDPNHPKYHEKEFAFKIYKLRRLSS